MNDAQFRDAMLARIAESKKSRQDMLGRYRDANLKTSARDTFNKLNASIDQKAQGLIGRNKAEYEAMKSQKLREADLKDQADREFWAKLMA